VIDVAMSKQAWSRRKSFFRPPKIFFGHPSLILVYDDEAVA
jgi:hypothetical protein